jgi:hypothetical protein
MVKIETTSRAEAFEEAARYVESTIDEASRMGGVYTSASIAQEIRALK